MMKFCWGTNPDFTAAPGQVDTCQVYTPVPLAVGSVAFVTPRGPQSATALACSGFTLAGFTTQGTVNAVPANNGTASAGHIGCAFTVTAGSVPAAWPIGLETVGIAAGTAGGGLQQVGSVCSDATCAFVQFPEQAVVVTGPGATVHVSNQGGHGQHCGDDNSQGDNNHQGHDDCHTGSSGHGDGGDHHGGGDGGADGD
jgi:hypothetical protein